jgi:nitroreductase
MCVVQGAKLAGTNMIVGIDGIISAMDAIEAIKTRVSPLRLAPQKVEEIALRGILEAGLSAADHGRLRPWKFLLVRGEARSKLGDVLAEALRHRDPASDDAALDAERSKPLRAPVIIVVAAMVRAGTKIPDIEQIESAAAAAQNMLVAAHALNLGGFWRTGAAAYDSYVKAALGLGANDHIVGFLYVGNVVTPGRPKSHDPVGVVEEWRARV